MFDSVTKTSPAEQLPAELIIHICSYLSLQDLMNARQYNSFWNMAIKNSAIWRYALMQEKLLKPLKMYNDLLNNLIEKAFNGISSGTASESGKTLKISRDQWQSTVNHILKDANRSKENVLKILNSSTTDKEEHLQVSSDIPSVIRRIINNITKHEEFQKWVSPEAIDGFLEDYVTNLNKKLQAYQLISKGIEPRDYLKYKKILGRPAELHRKERALIEAMNRNCCSKLRYVFPFASAPGLVIAGLALEFAEEAIASKWGNRAQEKLLHHLGLAMIILGSILTVIVALYLLYKCANLKWSYYQRDRALKNARFFTLPEQRPLITSGSSGYGTSLNTGPDLEAQIEKRGKKPADEAENSDNSDGEEELRGYSRPGSSAQTYY